MIHLILAISCSLVIGVLFKVAGSRNLDRYAILTINYVTAALVALLASTLESRGIGEPEPLFVLTGLGVGVLFFGSFTLYAAATEYAGLALATAAARISVVIPFLASWVIWSETPGAFQIPGIAVAIVALALLSVANPRHSDLEVKQRRATWTGFLLLALFLVAGATDTTMKLFQESFSQIQVRWLFMLIVFASAATVGTAVVLVRASRFPGVLTGSTLLVGVALGFVNYGSVEFFLVALSQLPGTLVFPVNHVAIVFGGTILGVGIWAEPLARLNIAGICLAALALVLLTT